MRAVLIALSLAASVVLCPFPAALADGPDVSVRPSGPLFGPAVRWVPGDSRTEALVVRNTGPDAGSLSITVSSEDPDLLAAHGDIDLSVREVGAAWRPLPVDGRAHAAIGATLGRGATVRLEVRAVFVARSPNSSQVDVLPLRFRLQLSQVAAPTAGGLLPETGGVPRALGLLALLLVGFGAGLLVLVRRKDRHEDHA